MRIVALVPSKMSSERLPAKNIKKLAGIPLVNYCLSTVNKIRAIDDIIIYASEPSICSYLLPGLRARFLKRPEYLDSQTTSIQDIIEEFIKVERADIIVLLHITSPFLKTETVRDCIEKIKSGDVDTAFTAFEMRKFCWFRGEPLNYSLEQPTPRTQDIDPVIAEQSSLYVFKRDFFEKTRQRTSRRAFIKIVDKFEGHDIDTSEDFTLAEAMVKAGLYETP